MIIAAATESRPKQRATRKRLSHAEMGHDPFRVEWVPIGEIKPAPENDKLYRPIDENDPQLLALRDSIREHGLQEPPVITLDGYIGSGHRRVAAAKLAGLKSVPVRRMDVLRSDSRFVPLLREFNRQREKTLDERLREEIVSVNQDDAYSALVRHRKAAVDTSAEHVLLGTAKRRSEITAAKQPMLDAIMEILEDRRAYWPLSDRTIHYALLNVRPLKHAGKPDSVYDNTLQSYKSTVELLTRARLCGLVPMAAISDETRPVTVWKTHKTAGLFIADELANFARSYWRDKMQSQPLHVELLAEKNTVEPIVRTIAERYTIPLTSGRGFCSIPPRQQMLQRFQGSGKDRMALIVVSDFDPEGESICESFVRSMRDDFGVDIVGIKAALTWQQTQELELPPALQAKETSSRYAGFADQYGDDVYELEALAPEKLESLVDEAVRSVIDINAYNREQEQERVDSAWLDVTRRRLMAAMAEISLDEPGVSDGPR